MPHTFGRVSMSPDPAVEWREKEKTLKYSMCKWMIIYIYIYIYIYIFGPKDGGRNKKVTWLLNIWIYHEYIYIYIYIYICHCVLSVKSILPNEPFIWWGSMPAMLPIGPSEPAPNGNWKEKSHKETKYTFVVFTCPYLRNYQDSHLVCFHLEGLSWSCCKCCHLSCLTLKSILHTTQ